MTNKVYIAEHGILGENGNILGVYEDVISAEYTALSKLNEETLLQTHSAGYSEQYEWQDDSNWSSVHMYWII